MLVWVLMTCPNILFQLDQASSSPVLTFAVRLCVKKRAKTPRCRGNRGQERSGQLLLIATAPRPQPQTPLHKTTPWSSSPIQPRYTLPANRGSTGEPGFPFPLHLRAVTACPEIKVRIHGSGIPATPVALLTHMFLRVWVEKQGCSEMLHRPSPAPRAGLALSPSN